MSKTKSNTNLNENPYLERKKIFAEIFTDEEETTQKEFFVCPSPYVRTVSYQEFASESTEDSDGEVDSESDEEHVRH